MGLNISKRKESMEIEQQEVAEVAETTPVEEAVQQEVASPEQPIVNQEVQTPAPEAVQKSDNSLDEFGVPYKNRYMEYKRKLEKAEKEKQEMLQQSQQTQPQRQYTIAELETFALETDNPAHKQWAISEAERIRENKQAELVRKELEGWKRQTEVENVKQQTFNAVIGRNPDLIIKDQAGNFAGWNPNSPLFNKINQYMSNPEISNHPRALEVAEAFAIRDLHLSSRNSVAQTLTKTNNALKSLQKKTLVEGGGSQVPQEVSPLTQAKQRLHQTGDAKAALREIFKTQGILKDV